MKKYILISGLFLCFACQENVQQPTETGSQDSLDLSEPLQVQTNRRVNLLPEAQEAVSEWLAFATAQHEVETMREATGREIAQNSQPLLQIMENLNSSLPDSLQVPAVRARTNVLLTKAGVLHQLSNKKNLYADEVYKAANELITEFDNFKLQLNELFLKSPEDFELELNREFEESQIQDTVPDLQGIRP